TNVTAGIGILENAAPMIQDYFPGITAAAAAGFVGILSLANMAGRFVWSTTSDYIGRKNIYLVYLGVCIILYLLIAFFGGCLMVVFIIAEIVFMLLFSVCFSVVADYLIDQFGL